MYKKAQDVQVTDALRIARVDSYKVDALLKCFLLYSQCIMKRKGDLQHDGTPI